MQFEIIKSQSITESMVLVASQIWGKAETPNKRPPDQVIGTAEGMAAFLKGLNSGR